MRKTYKSSGVDIAAGDEFVEKLKVKVRSTYTKNVISEIGAFSGLFDAKFENIKHPVLVASTDGVGTKLKVAFMMDKHDTIGEDLVNHCVNDIAVCGARPLFFLDYLAVGKLKSKVSEAVVDGIIRACRENGCSLIGGETAEMPGIYHPDEYDLAGTIIGVVEKSRIIDGRNIRVGDNLIALPSTGLHTNGYSLARSILFERYEVDDFIDELGMRLGDCLLTVHRSYLKLIDEIKYSSDVHGIAHITGGGIYNNTKRLLSKEMDLEIDWFGWDRPVIFQLIQRLGEVPEDDMRKTFNLGVGLVVIVSKRGTEKLIEIIKQLGENPFIIGSVISK